MASRRKAMRGRRSAEPGVHRMGGKEERTSDVRRDAAALERQDRRGKAPLDAPPPGPTSEQLYFGPVPKGRKPASARRASRVPRPRDPGQLEPEDARRASRTRRRR